MEEKFKKLVCKLDKDKNIKELILLESIGINIFEGLVMFNKRSLLLKIKKRQILI